MKLTHEWMSALFQQTAFISALLGGFAFTLVAVLLTVPKESRVASVTAAFASIAASGFVVCAVGWTLATPHLAVVGGSPENPDLQSRMAWLLDLHKALSMCFIFSLLSFMICLGISGWIRSRALGRVTTLAAMSGGALIIWILAHVSVRA